MAEVPLHLTLGRTQGKGQPGSPVFPPHRAGQGEDPEPSASIAVELALAGPSPAQLAAGLPVPAGLDRQGWHLGRGRQLRPGDDEFSVISLVHWSFCYKVHSSQRPTCLPAASLSRLMASIVLAYHDL